MGDVIDLEEIRDSMFLSIHPSMVKKEIRDSMFLSIHPW